MLANWAWNYASSSACASLPRSAEVIDDRAAGFADVLAAFLDFFVFGGKLLGRRHFDQRASGPRSFAGVAEARPLIERQPFEIVI